MVDGVGHALVLSKVSELCYYYYCYYCESFMNCCACLLTRLCTGRVCLAPTYPAEGMACL